MRFFSGLLAFLAVILTVTSAPLEERATIQKNGRTVAIVSGIVISTQLLQCFQNAESGPDIAQAYVAAIADQWRTYNTQHGGTFWPAKVEGLYASDNVRGLYCTTVDAVFTFYTTYSANVFAGWARGLLGNTKRDEFKDIGFALGDLKPDVYVAGVDLPVDHNYFGSSANQTSSDTAKRSWGRCSNNKCGFSFTNDQTSICRDKTFPSNHQFFC